MGALQSTPQNNTTSPYATNAGLQLNYLTKSEATNQFVSKSGLPSALQEVAGQAPFVTANSLQGLLQPYSTTNNVRAYVTSELAPYTTNTQLASQLKTSLLPYYTTAEAESAINQYGQLAANALNTQANTFNSALSESINTVNSTVNNNFIAKNANAQLNTLKVNSICSTDGTNCLNLGTNSPAGIAGPYLTNARGDFIQFRNDSNTQVYKSSGTPLNWSSNTGY